jgi:hypothetical protein
LATLTWRTVDTEVNRSLERELKGLLGARAHCCRLIVQDFDERLGGSLRRETLEISKRRLEEYGVLLCLDNRQRVYDARRIPETRPFSQF